GAVAEVDRNQLVVVGRAVDEGDRVDDSGHRVDDRSAGDPVGTDVAAAAEERVARHADRRAEVRGAGPGRAAGGAVEGVDGVVLAGDDHLVAHHQRVAVDVAV